ncbi:MAG TPA: hypothetical protein VKR54_00165 [Candidatus Babeliales bacterium]|jgi:hypothetical protein|nr:hypothetical protein [Candidatus Babeliales bacterium]
MTKRIVASIVLIVVVLFLVWYAYQEYKKSQKRAESFIEIVQD